MTPFTRRDARHPPRVGKESAMRPLARILLALSMGLASETIFAQEPAPDAPETAAPAPTPIPAGEAAPAETTLTAPADPMPSADAVEAPGDLAALAALVTAAQTPTPGPPETPVAQVAQVENRIEPPPPPPPAPRVEAAIGDVEDDAGLGRTATARFARGPNGSRSTRTGGSEDCRNAPPAGGPFVPRSKSPQGRGSARSTSGPSRSTGFERAMTPRSTRSSSPAKRMLAVAEGFDPSCEIHSRSTSR